MTSQGHHSPFGEDGFGKAAERFARFFGTAKFIVSQTCLIFLWIVLSATGVVKFDLYPFILLNLLFSTQAAYAAPLILLAQTRQADRDKITDERDKEHREELAREQVQHITENTEITNQIRALTVQIHELAEIIHQHIAAEPVHVQVEPEVTKHFAPKSP